MTDPSFTLTPRQQQVAELVALGCTDKAIAATLHISQRRVSRLVWQIGRNLHLDPTLDLRVQIAVRLKRAA